jgi:hypothetical protein
MPYELGPRRRAASESAQRALDRFHVYAWSGDLEDLDQAVAAWRSAVELTVGHGDSEAVDYLMGLLNTLLSRSAARPDGDDLAEVIDLITRIDSLLTEAHHGYAIFQAVAASALQLRYERAQDVADLDAAITRWEAAVRATPPDDEQLAERRRHLENAQLTRHVMTDPMMTEAIEATFPGIEDGPLDLHLRAAGHLIRYRLGGPTAEVESAIRLLDAAISHPDADTEDIASYQHSLGGAYLDRFSRGGVAADLDLAVDALRTAAHNLPPDHREFEEYFAALANAQFLRLRTTGNPQHVQDAVATTLWLRDHEGVSAEFTAQSWLNLCLIVQDSVRITGSVEQADVAVAAGRRAVEVAGAVRAVRAKALSSLAAALAARAEIRGGDPDELGEAAELAVRALADTRQEDQNWAGRAINAGNLLLRLSERTRQVEHLDRAIALMRAFPERPAAQRAAALLRELIYHLQRFQISDDLGDLTGAVDVGEDALRLTPPTAADYRAVLAFYLVALSQRAERARSVADVDRALELGREYLRSVSPSAPEWAMDLEMYSARLRQLRFTLTDDDADLDGSIRDSERAFAACISEHEVQLVRALGEKLFQRSVRSGTPNDARAAVRHYRAVAAQRPAGDAAVGGLLLLRCAEILAELFTRFGDLADARLGVQCAGSACDAVAGEGAAGQRSRLLLCTLLREVGVQDGDRDALDRAVRAGEELCTDLAADDKMAGSALYHYGAAVWERYRGEPAETDLELAVELGRRLVDLDGKEQLAHAIALYELAGRLRARHHIRRDDADLDEAINLLGAAVGYFPDSHPGRLTARYELSIALRLRYRARQDAGDLDTAIATMEAVLHDAPPDSPELGTYVNLAGQLGADRRDATEAMEDADPADGRSDIAVLVLLAVGQVRLFQDTGGAEYLDSAVSLLREVLAGTDSDHPDWVLALGNLANALRMRYAATGARDDIDEAVRLVAEAMTTLPTDHEKRAGVILNGARVYMDRFTQTSRVADIEEAIRLARLATGVGDARARARSHTALASCLIIRYETLGAVQDLQEAVRTQQTALESWPAGDKRPVDVLAVYSTALRMRYEAEGAFADLQQAVARGREALAAIADQSAGPLLLHDVRTSLALALMRLDQRQRSTTHASQVIDLLRADADAMQKHGNLAAMSWGNLASAYLARNEYGGDPADLDAAVEANERALAVVVDTNAELPYFLNRQCIMLIRRYQARNEATDLDAAIAAGRRAVTATVLDRPSAGNSHYLLGSALSLRAERAGGDDDATEAFDQLTAMIELPHTPAWIRSAGAQALGELAARLGRWRDAADAYALAIRLVEQTIGYGVSQQDREYELGRNHDLASDAAACALRADGVRSAVEVWDSARAALIAQILRTRDAELDRLERQHPELARRLLGLYRLLEDADSGPARTSIQTAAQTAQRIAEVVDEIRRQPGLQDFQRGLRLADLERLSSDSQPVVVVTVSRIACHAFVITGTAPRHLDLAILTAADVADRVLDLLRAIEAAKGEGSRTPLDRALQEILEWLGETVVAPVFRDLTKHGTFASPNPALTWCVSGLLGLLPVQAALVPAGPGSDELVPAFTRASFNFTPNLQTALRTRRDSGFSRDWDTRRDDILSVAVPAAPGHDPLPGAHREAQLLRDAFGTRVVELADQKATRAAVLALLPDRPFVHFACHSVTDPLSPADSTLVLHDFDRNRLTIRDIIRRNLPRGDLAYLSACSTANAGVAMSDQAMHLASAFHVAGYRAAIGTLWPIEDSVAVFMARAIYRAVARAGLSAAGPALRQACIDVHKRYPDRSSVWAGYVYYGR